MDTPQTSPSDGWRTRAVKAECKLAALAALAPVGEVDEDDNGLFVDLETPVGTVVKRGQKLYAAAGAAPADYEQVLADNNRLVRELDVLLNGESGAAKQASLCDLVCQIKAGAAPVPSWVSVAERLPEHEDVEFYSPDMRNPCSQLIGRFMDGKWMCAGYEMVNVTHWKPLAAAPKEQP